MRATSRPDPSPHGAVPARRARAALLLLALAVGPGAAAAEPLRASYEVRAAGLRIMEVEAMIDLDAPRAGYALELRTRLRGVAAAFGSGEGVSRASGTWRAGQARPAGFSSDGVWRGQARTLLMDYPDGQPVVRRIAPPDEEEREPVPEELRRGTLDSLSVLAQLMRNVAGSNRCEGRAAVFDGRRRIDFTAVTEGMQALPASGEAWGGEALRCRFEGRQVAGFPRDQPPEDRRPQLGTAWLAAPRPGTPPIPVRVEVPSRWFGALTATLVRVSAAAEGSAPPTR